MGHDPLRLRGRRQDLAGAATLVLLAAVMLAGPARAQSGEPIKIGYSMSLTGGLAPNGRAALLAHRIWEEHTNAKGGMLGRPVKLIYYDDKSSPAEVPSIYAKLLDVDKVDLIIGAYGTALLAAAMPIVIQRKKTFIGLLGLAVNSEFNYPNYFAMISSGPDAKTAFTRGFFDVALMQNPAPQTVAIVAADQEFARNAADGAREIVKQTGLKLVYDRTYPPATVDFSPIVRAIAAAGPDLVVVCSYPVELGRHGACGERACLQAKSHRRRHGWVAVHRREGTAWTVAQWVHQLRALAAGAENAVLRRGRSHFALSGEGGGRRRRSVGILHGALGLRAASGAATGRGGDAVAS